MTFLRHRNARGKFCAKADCLECQAEALCGCPCGHALGAACGVCRWMHEQHYVQNPDLINPAPEFLRTFLGR